MKGACSAACLGALFALPLTVLEEHGHFKKTAVILLMEMGTRPDSSAPPRWFHMKTLPGCFSLPWGTRQAVNVLTKHLCKGEVGIGWVTYSVS